MTRQYLNDRWCVRCGRCGPTPYLKTHFKRITEGEGPELSVLDIGCGNGRNSRFFKESGFPNVVSLDMVGDYGTPCLLGKYPLPLFRSSVNVILANYVFMFLDREERARVCGQMLEAAAPGCRLMVELYPAKDSHAPDEAAMLKLQDELVKSFPGWKTTRSSKGKFILSKPYAVEQT